MRRPAHTSTVELTPSPWQTEEDIAAEFARSHDLAGRLLAAGVHSWRAHYRWWGPMKVLAYKEVGPPPWRFPRVGIRRRSRSVRFIAGWRSTAFGVLFSWQRKPSHSGRAES